MKSVCLFVVLLETAVFIKTSSGSEDAKNIVQPCGTGSKQNGIDLECVKNYFDKYGKKCSKVSEANDNPVYNEALPIYVPKVNLTAVTTKTYFSHMNGKIEKFFYNKKTGNLVILVKFEGIRCYTPDSYFAFHRIGKEPKVFREYVKATYPVEMTAVIPGYNDITAEALINAEYFAYIANPADVTLVFGPKVVKSKDPLVQDVYKEALANYPLMYTEIFGTKSRYYFLAYLQNYICNYNLALSKQEYDLTVPNSKNDDDDETNVIKLCTACDDVTECVRNYFDKNGDCYVERCPNDMPLQRGKYEIRVPIINTTLHANNAQWTQGSLRGQIKSFYINKNSGNLVISVAFQGISVYTQKITAVKNLKGREPLVITDYSTHTYPVEITAAIPTSNGLTKAALAKAFVTAYFREPAVFVVGPKFTESKDPEMIANMQTIAADPMTTGQECLVTEASAFFVAYLQKYICNFGIPN